MKTSNLILSIALRHLFSKKRQTLVATLGVSFGIAIFLFQGGLMTGFQQLFIEQTINTSANIRIYQETSASRSSILSQASDYQNHWIVINNPKPKDEINKIRAASEIVRLLEKDKRIEGVSPSLSTQAIFKSGTAQVSGRIVGVHIEKENMLFNVEKNNIAGSIQQLQTIPNGIIIGAGLAQLLGVQLNDNIMVITPSGISLQMKVVAINKTGIVEQDKSRAYVNIRNAQILLGVDHSFITDINLKLKNIEQSSQVASELQKKWGYKALDWKEANANIFGIFRIQNMVTYLVITTILIVSGFGIFNILMMIIYEKFSDIAILKAIGFTSQEITKIFLAESLIIGTVGGIGGLGLGFLLQKIVGSIRMNVQGFISVEYLKFNTSPELFAFAFLFALLVTAIAGYLPARKAAKIDPIEILRSK
ncbi:MAG: FtsX-like permease family protein [Bacteroidia bacterium]|nr:FtsX-like permease family protein [Bacteroidia bacterium]MDW8157821.1 FtsX-like permease family protein [Bacteroidia bacterium]